MTTDEVVTGSVFLVIYITAVVWAVRTNRRAAVNQQTLRGQLKGIGNFKLRTSIDGSTWYFIDTRTGMSRAPTVDEANRICEELLRVADQLEKMPERPQDRPDEHRDYIPDWPTD